MTFLYVKELFIYLFILLGFLIFGSGIIAVIVLHKSIRYHDNVFVEILKYVTTFMFGIVFQPFLLGVTICLLTILLALLILFFPLVLLIYFKTNSIM
jgi:hypothetical protein